MISFRVLYSDDKKILVRDYYSEEECSPIDKDNADLIVKDLVLKGFLQDRTLFIINAYGLIHLINHDNHGNYTGWIDLGICFDCFCDNFKLSIKNMVWTNQPTKLYEG